ncbi:LOW QUALITY PROTEIN: hypothetical protein J003_00386 [Cryptococcus neoformans]|nr:LOW QUALITY PROTEIN: hypothetical protein J003_00386 [Cryptococcus neoformans var. grubii]
MSLGGGITRRSKLPDAQAKRTPHNTSYQPSILVDRA